MHLPKKYLKVFRSLHSVQSIETLAVSFVSIAFTPMRITEVTRSTAGMFSNDVPKGTTAYHHHVLYRVCSGPRAASYLALRVRLIHALNTSPKRCLCSKDAAFR